MDLAHLGIKISYADIDKAINKLKELERTGKSVQSQVENITVKAKVDTSAQEKAKEFAKQIADGYKAADAATAVLDSELHKLTMSYDKVASAAKNLVNRIDLLANRSKVSSSSIDALNAQLELLKKHASEIGQWRNVEGLNFLLKTAEERLDSLNRKLTEQQSLTTQAKQLAAQNKKVAESFQEADAAVSVYDSELHKLTLSYDKIANATKNLINRIDVLSEKDKIAAGSIDNLNAQLRVLKKHASEMGQWRNIEGLNFLLKTAEERLAKLQAIAKKKLELVKPRTSTELNKITAELKSLERQAQILGETSSVSAREVDKLAARLKYLEKQASLKGLSQGNRELQTLIRQTGQSIDNLTGKIKTSDNIVKRWWKRFGEVGVGFTLIYQTVNLVTGAIHSLNQVILDGIKLSGELVSAQAKLSMWLEMGSQGAIRFQEAMNVSKQTIQALADASLTSTSTLKELATGLDEVSQAGVFISKDVMPKFADLIDFTKMVAETTGSTTRQIRQELQALMQGEVKTTNLLVRTAQQLHILTDEDIQGLKEMQNRQEVIEKLSESISSYWGKVKEVIISADVNTAFDKWYDSLTRLVTKATELTSEKQGTMNIFGVTIYKHIQELNKELQNMNVEKYENFFLGLNIALDKFLTLAEKAVKGLISIDISTDSVNLKFKELENFTKGVLTPFQLFYKIAKDLDDKLVDLTGALEDMGIHLVSIHKIVGEAFVYRLIFGNWKAGFVLTTLTEIDNLISDIIGEGEKSHSIINSLKGAAEYGIIGTYLFGWEAGLTIGALKLVVDYFSELRKAGEEARKKREGAVNPYIQEHLDKYFAKKYPTTPEELEKWRKKVDEELDKTVKKYKKAIEDINNTFKKLKEETELKEYAQKIKESLMTPIEKLIEEKKKLDKLVKTSKITKEEELKYLAKEAKSYLGLKSSIEDVIKILSKSPDTWKANLKALIENEQATEEFKKHLEDLKKYAQQLEESASPLEKFIKGFQKLQETQKLVGLSNKAYAQGLLEISKNIVDTTDKEKFLKLAFEAYADELKQLPLDQVIEKIKELANSFTIQESAWQKGIKAYISDVKSMKDEIADLIHGMFSQLEDMLARFLASGKLSIKDFSEYIINQIARIYARQYMVKPLAQYMQGIMPISTGSSLTIPPITGSSSLLSPSILTSLTSTNSSPVLDITTSAIPAITGTGLIMTSAPIATSGAIGGLSLMPTTSTGAFGNLSLMPAATGTTTTTGAFSNLSLMSAATTSSGLSLSQALPYAGWSALGYSTLGSWLGLPQSQYSPFTAGAGGMGGALLASSFAINPVIGAGVGALLGGATGGLFGHHHVDDVDLHIYFGNPNESYPQGYSGLKQSEFFDIDRAINEFMSVNIRKGSHMSNEQARQLEQAIANYFQGLFNNLDTQFNISVKDVLEGQAIGFHENDYSGDLQATLSKYTDEFFKNFTDELTESILGYSINYDTLKKFQQSSESIADTFSRIVGNLREIPHAAELIGEYMSQSGDDVVTAYNKLVETWQNIRAIVDTDLPPIQLTTTPAQLKQQFIGNIRQQVGSGLANLYQADIKKQLENYLLQTYGITDWNSVVSAVKDGTISIEAFNNALNEFSKIIDNNAEALDMLFQQEVALGNIDVSWVFEKIPNAANTIQDYIDRTGKTTVEAYNDLVAQWNYISNMVSNAFQNISLTFNVQDLKQQFLTNFKQNLGNQLIQGFYQSLSDQISGAIFSTYGIADFTQLADYLMNGTISIEAFNNALADIGNIIDQNSPKLEHLKQIFEDLGLLDDYYKQQYEQAKANYINALQATISDLQQKQQQLEQNFQKAKQTYIQVLQNEISELQQAQQQLEQRFQKAKQTYIQVLQNEISELQKAQQQLEQNFQKAKNDYIKALQAEINKKQEAANSAKSLIETFKNLSNSLKSYKQDLIENSINPASYNYTRAQFLSLTSNLGSSDNKVLQETIKKIPDTARIFLEQSRQYNTYEEYLRDYYLVMKILNRAQNKSIDVQKEQQDKLDNIKSEIEELNERYKEIDGQDIKDLAEAAQAYYDAKLELDNSYYPDEIQRYDDILEELRGNLPDIATASKDYRDALNALKNSYYPDAIQKYQDILEELRGNLPDIATASKDYRDALNALKNSYYPDAINYYNDIYGKLKDIHTDLPTAEDLYNYWKKAYEEHGGATNTNQNQQTTSPTQNNIVSNQENQQTTSSTQNNANTVRFPFNPSKYGWGDELYDFFKSRGIGTAKRVLRNWGITAPEYAAWLQRIGHPMSLGDIHNIYGLPYDYKGYFDPSRYGWTKETIIDFLAHASKQQIQEVARQIHLTAGGLAAYARHIGYNYTAEDLHRVYGLPFMAEGGTVYKPTLAVVGEAGIEHITPDSQMKEVKEKLSEIREILWMMLNTTGDNKKSLTKLYNLVTGWDYDGLPPTRE